MMKIQVSPDACTGCRLCRQICSIEKAGSTNPRWARLRIEARFPQPGKYVPHVCDDCGQCAEACPTEAIARDDRGVYVVDKELCTLCGACLDACPQQVMGKNDDDGVPYKCDFCFGCTEVCNTGALVKVE
ncbi:MAG: 4Fe-4S dicluster domain-containing protein [Candidatus Riflebacteria bacterium]|nr:4Fe-4S dicluster domain-containing protein [Candidatus Riflebacteria bacterium]